VENSKKHGMIRCSIRWLGESVQHVYNACLYSAEGVQAS